MEKVYQLRDPKQLVSVGRATFHGQMVSNLSEVSCETMDVELFPWRKIERKLPLAISSKFS